MICLYIAIYEYITPLREGQKVVSHTSHSPPTNVSHRRRKPPKKEKKAHVPHIPSYSPIIASACPVHERLFEGQLFQTTARNIKRISQFLHKTIQNVTLHKSQKRQPNNPCQISPPTKPLPTTQPCQRASITHAPFSFPKLQSLPPKSPSLEHNPTYCAFKNLACLKTPPVKKPT